MNLQLTYEPYTLYFKFDAGTSRGVMRERKVWFLRLFNPDLPSVVGVGEVAPLEGLSLDALPTGQMEAILNKLCAEVPQRASKERDLGDWITNLVPPHLPSVRFGLETAFLDLKNGGKGNVYHEDFATGQQRLVINGLIWMGTPDFMRAQIEEKLANGFECLKLKIGALDFAQEIAILKSIRQRYTAQEITLRVDANGAFLPADALEKLKRLADLDIHSIEQPIKAGQIEEMARLCALSPLPIALDEELIPAKDKIGLLQTIKPAYIILKPSLIGSRQDCTDWITTASALNIGWWLTSALESNIGLNAICQMTADFLAQFPFGKANPRFPQGLGTGQLYHNNIPSPLHIHKGQIFCRPAEA